MNTLKNILGLIVITLVIVSCKNEAKPEVMTVETASAQVKSELDPNATYAKAEFNIEGMTCEIGCAKTIQKKLAGMDGVKSATVDFDNAIAMVEFDEAKVTPTSLEETVKKTGETYTVKNMKTVEAFSAKSDDAKNMNHPKECDKDCCKGKTEAQKKECAADCKMACCADKKVKTD